jgi:PDZ domain
MTRPPRPSTVPAEATWNDLENEWERGATRGNKSVGDWTWWRPDGTLVCRSRFDDEGELDGVCRRYHPDGRVSMESRYVHGVRWGKTRHTRSLGGNSPEDVHLAALPNSVFEIALAYKAGESGPIAALLGRAGVESPPASRLGVLPEFERDIGKYLPGTAMLAIGTFTDIAGRRFDAPALFFDGLAMEDGSSLRFAFAPPGVRTSKKPAWQDPDYGTVLTTGEAKRKLIVGVDYVDALFAPGHAPPDPGFAVETSERGVSVRMVEKGGAAARARLRAGDRIVRMNERLVASTLDYLEGRVELAAARRIRLEVARKEATLTLDLDCSAD